jgi:hypothetical protein
MQRIRFGYESKSKDQERIREAPDAVHAQYMRKKM